jgi:hypothetical protein
MRQVASCLSAVLRPGDRYSGHIPPASGGDQAAESVGFSPALVANRTAGAPIGMEKRGMRS